MKVTPPTRACQEAAAAGAAGSPAEQVGVCRAGCWPFGEWQREHRHPSLHRHLLCLLRICCTNGSSVLVVPPMVSFLLLLRGSTRRNSDSDLAFCPELLDSIFPGVVWSTNRLLVLFWWFSASPALGLLLSWCWMLFCTALDALLHGAACSPVLVLDALLCGVAALLLGRRGDCLAVLCGWIVLSVSRGRGQCDCTPSSSPPHLTSHLKADPC